MAGAGIVEAPFCGDAGTVDAPFCGGPSTVDAPFCGAAGAVETLDVRSSAVVSVEVVPPHAESAVLSKPTVASATSRSPTPRQPQICRGT